MEWRNFMTVQELQKQHDTALAKADSIISAAERQKRPTLTTYEQQTIDAALKEADELKPKLAAAKANAFPTKSAAEWRAEIAKQPRLHVPRSPSDGKEPLMPATFSQEYFHSFWDGYMGGSGPVTGAMYEGTSTGGGYAVPIAVAGQAVPLAPQDSAVRRLAKVIPTQSDIKTAQVTARGTVAAKSETSSFTVAVPSLGQFTLSAFAAGVEVQTSLELSQDVNLLDAFVLEDAMSAFLEYEESLFISGSGNGQAQGLIGNVGAGVVEEPDSSSNLVSIQGTLDILGQLRATYHSGASWLMQRATSLIIRKAQVAANLFEPVFTRYNGQDYLHGYPVEYSSAMPTAARGNTPILFGDFAKGYLIGDRGGPALFLKKLDQTGAALGLIDLLFYRRTDGRVRRSEAIQSYTVAAS
jgi:HK97 family phage major capsid protein